MAESVVSFVVERIGDLLIQEAKFLAGVSDQVEKMKTELKFMQSFLKDADKRQDKDELVRVLVSEIRGLAYDAENVIETFALQVASRRETGFRNRCKRYATICTEGANVHKVGKEIKAIQGKITDLTRSLQTYGIKNEGQGSTSMQQRKVIKRSYSHLAEEHTVGLDNDVQVLVTKLRDEETEIVSICGMGGLGKTTLANKLYHDVKARDHFEAFAWHCVSQQFQPREVWEGILIKLTAPSKERREEISLMKDDEIAKALHRVQQTKKCLVVLDDIWREDAWEDLKAGFPLGKGSKIVMTTRNKVVASHVNHRRAYIHEYQPLNEQDSWKLFQLTTFPNPADFKCSMNMENLGKEIVKKCKGLPLAIIVLGRLLATKHSLSEWDEVHKNVDLYLRRGKGTDQEYSIVNGVLALSYNELPYHLKPCFLHLGHFPEDYEISCKTLFRMWAAEGFGSQCQHVGEGNETMEDVVERYLHELINRSIVQVSRMESTGRVKTCRLHDLMRDFCLLKANEENYLAIVGTTNLNEKPNVNKVYRLGVHGNNYDIGCYGSYLRSLLVFEHRTETIAMNSTFNDIKLLKILRLEGCVLLSKMIKEIGSLIHLRYLSIEGESNIGALLPSSIGNLRYLQTLIIRPEYGYTIIVPNVVWKLEELRHLILGDVCKIKGDEGLKLGNKRKMQTLQLGAEIVLHDAGELGNSSRLKKLRIRLKENLGKIPSGCLKILTSLSIRNLYSRMINEESEEEMLKRLLSSCSHLRNLSYYGMIKLPTWQHFPPNLTKLTLKYCGLEEDPMPILEKLPNLCILRLWGASFRGRSLVCSSQGFPKLQTLVLQFLVKLEEWRVDEETMPNLIKLHIYGCKRLKMIPEGIKFITTLRQLTIAEMPKEFEDRVRLRGGGGIVDGREEGADFYKVQHVSSINIIQDTY